MNWLARTAPLLAVVICGWIAPTRVQAQLLPPLPVPVGSLIVNVTAPGSGATVSGTVTVSASVSIVGGLTVAGVRFRVDGVNIGGEDTSAPYSVSWNTRTVGNGSHTLTAVARDILGVQWTSNSVTVTVFNDTTAPTVSITSPANGATVFGTVTISANTSDNVGVAGVRFRLDGANLGAEDTTAPYSVPWNTATAANGSHTLTAVARDAAGNTRTSAPVTVTVSNGPPPDTTPPSVSITSPASGATLSGTVNVTASASDNVGVVGVQFFANGVLGADDTTAPYSVPWNTATAANGSHTLTAVARDAAGNTRTSAPVTITVDNGGTPTVSRFEEDSPAISASPAGAWVRRGPEVAAFSGGTAGGTDVAGATVTFTFTGTAVSWIGLKCSICGIATVSVDGGAPIQVNTAGTAAPGSPGLTSEAVFSATGLATGSHTLALTVTGNTASGGAHIVVDAFDVTGAAGAGAATRIEDTDPAVSYAGNWVHLNDTRASGGALSESETTGAAATVSFTGTGVRWLSAFNSNNGIARITLDGTFVGEVDTYGPTLAAAEFAATGLARGAHTLTIEVTGRRNPASVGNWVIIDGFDVTP